MNTTTNLSPINPNTHFDGYQINTMVGNFQEAIGCDEFDIDINGANGCMITSPDRNASIEATDARLVTGKEYGYRTWQWESGDQSSQPELVALMNYLNGNT